MCDSTIFHEFVSVREIWTDYFFFWHRLAMTLRLSMVSFITQHVLRYRFLSSFFRITEKSWGKYCIRSKMGMDYYINVYISKGSEEYGSILGLGSNENNMFSLWWIHAMDRNSYIINSPFHRTSGHQFYRSLMGRPVMTASCQFWF